MGKSAFKLKSGNISGGSSFKMMGSSKAPQMEGSSPMQQGRFGILKSVYNYIKYGRTTVPKAIDDIAVKKIAKKVTNPNKNIKSSTRVKNAEDLVEAVQSFKPETSLAWKTLKWGIPSAAVIGGLVGGAKNEADARGTEPTIPEDYNVNTKRKETKEYKTYE